MLKQSKRKTTRPALSSIWVTFLILIACTPATTATHLPTPIPPTAKSTPPTTSTTLLSDIVLTVDQFNRPVNLTVGQILTIQPPSLSMEWQVDYSPTYLELLTPSENVRSPGEAGWLFRAISPGRGQIILTSIVACGKPPCPVMPMRFELNVQVQ